MQETKETKDDGLLASLQVVIVSKIDIIVHSIFYFKIY